MGLQHLMNLTSDRLRTLPVLVTYLTDGCNSRCAMCDIWRSPRRNMSDALMDTLIDSLRPLQVRWLVLSGGEVMQHPGWARVAERARAEGVRVFLLTNALLLTRQIESVIAHVDELVVSLDAGTAPTYEAIRGVDGFDRVLEGISLASAGGVQVTTRTTLQAANFRELPQIIDAAQGAGAHHISFLPIDVANPVAFGPRFPTEPLNPLQLLPVQEHQPPAMALNLAECEELTGLIDSITQTHADAFERGLIAERPAKLHQFARYFRAVAGEGSFPTVRCNAPHVSTVVEVDGTLRPCYFLPTWGKLEGRSLASALNDPAALTMRQAYRRGERQECEACVCPLYKGVRSLGVL